LGCRIFKGCSTNLQKIGISRENRGASGSGLDIEARADGCAKNCAMNGQQAMPIPRFAHCTSIAKLFCFAFCFAFRRRISNRVQVRQTWMAKAPIHGLLGTQIPQIARR
jgi:hypothetical protein